MSSHYNASLVAFSLVVATLASYTALDLADRISLLAYARVRPIWLAGGALAMGIGIWSMHFIGMLSFSLNMPLGYDPALTIYSLLITILVSGFALHMVTRSRLSTGNLLAGGVLMGAGIAAMHYMGMAAMLMHPGIDYEPVTFAASIVIAIGASTSALWLARTLRGADPAHLMKKRIGAACVMGVAIFGMHYTGMAAARFADDSVCGAAGGIGTYWLAAIIIPATFVILIATLMLSRRDARAAFVTSSIARIDEEIGRVQGNAHS